MKEKINELFFNYDKFYELIDQGIYVPTYIKKYNGDLLTGALFLKAMIKHFEKNSEFEKCQKIKEQLDFLMRKVDVEEVKFIDFTLEENSYIHYCPYNKAEAIDYIHQEISKGNSHNLDSLDLLDKKTSVLTAMLYGTYAPVIISVFALDEELSEINPIMIDFAHDEVYDIDEMSYNLIFQSVEYIKSSF